MDLKQLFNDDDAVSPVIGVILMVAITVILAAVIASFVLGLGDQTSTTPTASFSFDYEQTDASNERGVVTITHDSGDPINEDELYVRGSGFESSGDISGTSSVDQDSAGTWQGTSSSDSEVVAGDSNDVGANSEYNFNVIYQSAEGDTSSTLSSDKGPDA
ncbi:type IV pilin N-terminal domain-containing protein [Halomicrobium sp. IBSBa]|uniref:type IV pilin n=1 Tax=Halomicrobium sp. IBSBa TaxID=2778916 RepID=UPI001ABF8C91|nr:type IV pilin N-terminal domain-containing protein [Halomicrobium sp. IBSBa]MBO4246673.1 type IV pilin N-terminal domain-containing protein [Halomicrobium sp. IBSBa]